MKYTRIKKVKGGKKIWSFEPPKKYIDAGVVKRMQFTDGRSAWAEVKKALKVINDYNKGKISASLLTENDTFRQGLAYYMNSSDYLSLSPTTQDTYRLVLERVMRTSATPYKKFGDLKIKDITLHHCSNMYDEWLKTSVDHANQTARILSVFIHFLRRKELLVQNPMSLVKKQKHKVKKVIWTPEQVEQFLDTAYSDFETRNIGLIIHMIYDWCQRPVDIRNLRWDQLDLDKQRVKIEQQKTGVEVELPISDELTEMLKEQKSHFGFQDYVVPYLRGDKAWRPMTSSVMNDKFKVVLRAAGLPEELQVRHLRRTGITEMVEAGVDPIQIMSVSGHSRIESLNPYTKHTYNAAKSALDRRKK